MAAGQGRKRSEIRPIKVTKGYIASAPGSILFEMGNTRVLCVATAEEAVPPFLRGTGRGWVTAEYGMLPRSSTQRIPRESAKGRIKGRTHEIQRLIGRSLRAAVDLSEIGERTITIDCDVIEADGGTRTASINGGFLALAEALAELGLESALRGHVAAVSVGICGGKAVLDLDYRLDSTAEVDMNVVMNGSGEYIELQGTAEDGVFSPDQLDSMLKLAGRGIREIIKVQKKEMR